MIEQNVTGGVVVKNLIAATSNRMGVTVNNKLFSMMSDNIYSNIPNAIVRELTSNAIDASIAAGTNEPVIVHIPKNISQDFYIQDFGSGMSIETMIHVFANYFSSTKENDEKQIGGFGLGAKTPFAYVEERGFRVETTSPDDGVRRTFDFKRVEDELGDKYPHYQHLDDLDIVNSSIKGTKVSFALKNQKDINDFVLACVPMLYAVHPIDFKGNDIRSYLPNFNQDKHDNLLKELKETGIAIVDSHDKFHMNFNLNNLFIRNEKLESSNFNKNDLKKVLNLRLGSVIYQIKMNNDNEYDEVSRLWSFLNRFLTLYNTKIRVLMIDVQQNGYITLDVSRENVRDTVLNNNNIKELLLKNIMFVCEKSIKLMQEKVNNLEDTLKEKNLKFFLNRIKLFNTLKSLVLSFKEFYLKENKNFENNYEELILSFEKTIDDLNDKIHVFEQSWVKLLDKVFLLNFDNKNYVDGQKAFELLKNDENFNSFSYIVDKDNWKKVVKNEELKKEILNKYKKDFIILSENQSSDEWKETLSLIFKSSRLETLNNIIKDFETKIANKSKNEEQVEINFEDVMNGDFQCFYHSKKLNENQSFKANTLTLPSHYKIQNKNKLSNMDKSILMYYAFLGKIFGFDFEGKEEVLNSYQMQNIKDFNETLFDVFDEDCLAVLKSNKKTQDILFKVDFVSEKRWKKMWCSTSDYLKNFFHLFIDVYSKVNQEVKKPYIMSIGDLKDKKQALPKVITKDTVKKHIMRQLEKFSKCELNKQIVSFNTIEFDTLKLIVFSDLEVADKLIFNYFENKHHLMEMAQPYYTPVSNVNDINEYNNKLKHNINLYKKIDLNDYFKNHKNSQVFIAYDNEQDLTSKMKKFFNVLYQIKYIERESRKSNMSFEVNNIENIDMVFEEVKIPNIEPPKNINDLNPILNDIFKKETESLPQSKLPKDNILALYLKILEES